MTTLYQLYEELKEEKFNSYSYKYNIIYDLHSTIHSNERKSRHSKSGINITNEELSELIKKSIPVLTKKLVYDDIDIRDELLLTDGYLNIVCTLLPDKDNTIRLVIITTMKKKNFKAKNKTKVIQI